MRIESSINNIDKNSLNAQENKKSQEESSFNTMLIEELAKMPASESVPVHLRKYDDSKLSEKQFDQLVEKLDLNNLSKKDKELYKSIIDNGYISNEEIEGLSYEQMKTLGKFVFKKDDSGKEIDETFMNSDLKAGALLSTAVISKNDNFNKSVFKIVEKLEKNEEITKFMYSITGTFHGSSLIAFPELQTIKYDDKDINQFLEEQLSSFKNMLEVSANAELSKILKTLINQFDDLINLFDKFSKNKEENDTKNSYEIDIVQELIDDLMSLMETGLTKTEAQSLEKLIRKIKEKIEDSKDTKVSEENIKELILQLEEKVKEIKKRLIGDDTIEIQKNSKNTEEEGLSAKMQEFRSIVQSLEKALEKALEEASKNSTFTSSHEELTLRKKLSNI